MNVGLYRIELNNKVSELTELQNEANPTNEITDRIEELEKDIKKIRSKIARIEIAKLLGLLNDNHFKSIDYIGIEEVDHSNLSQEDQARYNTLIQDVDLSETAIYSNRVKMAKILDRNNDQNLIANGYEGIERENPSNSIYGLTQDQIDEFNRLKQETESLLSNASTYKLDERRVESEELIRLFNELNVSSVVEYERKKEQYLDILSGFIDAAKNKEGSGYNVNFAPGNNYKFVKDLKEKYPELNFEMNMNALTDLFNKVRTDTNMEEEQYNDYLTFLADNIKKMYEKDENKVAINALISSIGTNELKFRIDLSSKLGNIEGIDLSLKDNELEPLFKMIDENYDTLDENLRNKYFGFIEKKLSEKLKDPNQVEAVNNLFLNVKNKEFNKRLQNTFGKEKMAKFANVHYTATKNLINEEIKKLEKKKAELLKKDHKLDILDAHRDVRVAKIDKEIEKLKKLELSYEDSTIITSLDNRYNNKTDKIIALEKEIASLKKLKNDVKSSFAKKIIDKKIKRRTNKVSKLAKSKVNILGAQKTVMVPKSFVNRKKGMTKRSREAKMETYESRANDYKNLAENERERNSMFSGIKAAFYEWRSGKYSRKADLNRKIYDSLSNGNVRVQGSNTRTIPRTAANRFRQNNQQTQAATL